MADGHRAARGVVADTLDGFSNDLVQLSDIDVRGCLFYLVVGCLCVQADAQSVDIHVVPVALRTLARTGWSAALAVPCRGIVSVLYLNRDSGPVSDIPVFDSEAISPRLVVCRSKQGRGRTGVDNLHPRPGIAIGKNIR